MSDEYTWLSEYLTLIKWLHDRYGGTVEQRHSDKYSRQGLSQAVGRVDYGPASETDHTHDANDNILGLDSYPAYHAVIDDIPVSIALSGRDELSISLKCLSRWEFRLRHELRFDRVMKFLRLDYEFKSGDPDFDRTYYIETIKPSNRDIFRDATFREYVKKLEPFVRLVVTDSRLATSRKIDNPDYLIPSTFSDFATQLIKIARYVK